MASVVRIGTEGAYDIFLPKPPLNVSRLTLKAVNSKFGLTVPYSPLQVTHSNIGRDFTIVSRPARIPVIVSGNVKVPTMSFDLFLGSQDPTASCEATIKALANLANNASKVSVTYGKDEGGIFIISSFSWTSTMRHPTLQYPTRATATIELTQAAFLNLTVGPVSGGATSGGSSAPGATKKPVKHYKVKKGDTFHSISLKFYGKAKFYTRIMDANHIKNPKKLKVGMKLIIP